MIDATCGWARAGSGLELQFFATDDEIYRYLAALPRQWEPYRLIGTELILEKDIYRRQPFDSSPDDFFDLINKGRWQFWIWSMALLPDLKHDGGEFFEETLSLNGLPLLQHGLTRNQRREVSRISIVDTVQRVDSGEIVFHDNQVKLFRALKKTIKKDLAYSTIQVFRDGHEEEDAKVQLMTQGAVDAAKKGYPFARKSGRPL